MIKRLKISENELKIEGLTLCMMLLAPPLLIHRFISTRLFFIEPQFIRAGNIRSLNMGSDTCINEFKTGKL